MCRTPADGTPPAFCRYPGRNCLNTMSHLTASRTIPYLRRKGRNVPDGASWLREGEQVETTSRKAQHVENQEKRLRDHGCEETYRDKATGKAASRPQWDQCLSHLRRGDTLVVTKLDRIGRSLVNLVDVVTMLVSVASSFSASTSQSTPPPRTASWSSPFWPRWPSGKPR